MENLQNKVFIAIISVLLLYALVCCIDCSGNGKSVGEAAGSGIELSAIEEPLAVPGGEVPEEGVPASIGVPATDGILSQQGPGLQDGDGKGEAPAVKSSKPNKIVYWNRRREFNDMNDVHLEAAQQIGIAPLASRDGIPGASRKLYLICSNMGFAGPEPYVVDRLTHSTPYLVKEAADLLYEIGVCFQDSLRNKHLAPYSVVVTSVLRTDADVKNLSKRNVNASKRSVHCYGTTFDISYKRFVKLDRNAPDAREADLIAVLGEVLRDLKINGRCYVKHEVKQACFHITARKRE